MKNYFSIIMIDSLVLVLFAGCNIFDWTSENKDKAFYEGIEFFNDGKFTQAKEKFAEAMQLDPKRSDYRYYHAKAVVFEANLNFFAIAQNVIKIDTSSIASLTLPLYTKDPDLSLEQDAINKTKIYSVGTICRNDIKPIYLEQTHGDIQAQDIYFDYAILSLSLALLRLRDTNGDGIIGSNDFYFEIVKSSDGKYAFDLLSVINYLRDSNNQRSFNRTLLSSADYVADGVSSLFKVIGNDTTYFNQTDLTDFLDNVSSSASRYQIGDDIDNDGDGRIDEEILNGIDDDGDGWIDEDVGIVP
jgi:tetratricopeptide (TPR) repeat protein